MAVDTCTWKLILVLMGLFDASNGMNIPEDMEILEGYDLSLLNIELASNDDGFYERRSLLEPFYYRAIRDKRETQQRVLDSPGLYRHFWPRESNIMHANLRKRERRNVNGTAAPVTTIRPHGLKTGEEIPLAEKQTMKDSGQIIGDQWANPYKTPEFQAKILKKEDDYDAEASMMINEGIKSRAPRVNFITQQTKSREASTHIQRGELYRKPMARTYYVRPARDYDSYMAPSQSPMYPRIYDKYDAFHRDMMDRLHPPSPHQYDQYYQRRIDVDYDSYFPRHKFSHFYYYPDKRYDTPLHYRDRNYVYTKDIAGSGYPLNPTYRATLPPMSVPTTVDPVMRNRRIIYYATLPEIVRTPTNADFHHRFNKIDRNRHESFYTTQAPPALSAYNDLRQANDQNCKED
uniref:Uncharacterized protein n=1 Tax=Anopheles atroparvus TaxID=41427 RepID=A0AAG5D3Y2_ANOAO